MVKKILKWLLVFISVVFLFGYFFQERFIFLATQLPKDFKFSLDKNFEEVNLKTTDGETNNAIHFKINNPKGVILYFHGNRGDLTRWGEITKWFTQFNYDVFVMDYRNYGKSTGDFNEKNMLNDALLAYDYLKEQYDENDIIVYGRSLGTTFATKAASKNNPKALILEVPFYNLMSAVKYQIKFSPGFLFNYKFRTNDFIKDVKCPVTIFHGTEDKVTNPKDSNKLYELVQHPNKKLFKIEGGTHGNLREFETYKNNLKAILEE